MAFRERNSGEFLMPHPVVKGDRLAIEIPETLYQETINVEDSSEVLIQEKSKEKEKESIVLPVLEQVPLQTLQARPVYKETAVLSPVELFKAQDIQLEQYLNANVVVADGLVQSGSDESIVNATQSQVGIASASNTDVQVQVGNASASNADVDQRQTPDRIIKDMQFLKESWAAMAEEEENLVISENEVEIQNDGFQVSMSKHQKKVLKKKTRQVRILMLPGQGLIPSLLNEVCLLEYKGFG
ncbi:hypothetical protein QL285_046086 [Trifolium repens]|nr:hypothetical protein QL285_046086 [Trifolium repens]